MQSWFKYSLSFFALVLLLAGFIYVFGPSTSRQAAQSGQSPVGQLGPNATLTSSGEAPLTTSGTTQQVDAPLQSTGPLDKKQSK